MWLLFVSCAWVAGIFLIPKFSLPFVLIFSFILPLLFIPFLNKIKARLIIISLCILSLFAGGLHYTSNIPQEYEHTLCDYIDTEESNNLMIAMTPDDLAKTIENKKNNKFYIKYTHCELHPSMVFGVLVSNIPYCNLILWNT